MNDNYNEIVRSGGSHEDMVMDLYSALLTSKNNIFNQFIQRSKDDWETKQDISIEELTTLATEKFNNMSEQRQWDSSSSKSDSSKIVALTTQVEELQKKLSDTKGKSEAPKKSTPFLEVAEWRKTKSFGPSVTKDGRDWHWCSIKHNNGKGMYVTHREEDHGNFRRNKSKDSTSTDTSKAKEQTNKTMTLSDNLKAAMVTKFKCSNEEAARLWADVAKNDSQDF
jgi:hypothetical protein